MDSAVSVRTQDLQPSCHISINKDGSPIVEFSNADDVAIKKICRIAFAAMMEIAQKSKTNNSIPRAKK